MCGIGGVISSTPFQGSVIVNMTKAVAHRGPDGAGYCFWTTDNEGLQCITDSEELRDELWVTAALGHRRLSILDLSEAGAQPMQAEDGKYVIVFNGEIFNYLELRSVLRQQGHVFRSDSDTEVALHAYMEWGTDCFNMFNGMWAMAIVDVPGDRVLLSRDRLGIKPLYLHCSDGRLAFFSEIKQGLTLPWLSRRADMHNVIEFIDTGYQSPSSTFFQDVHVHAAGTFSVFGFRDAALRCTTRYWPAENIQSSQIGEGILQEQLGALFQDSVKIRLRADVPVGISLSGGLDSSSIYATVRTLKDDGAPYAFSAVYNSEKYDEIPYVDLLMQRNGGEVQQVVVTPEGMLRDLDDFIYHHDEPPGSMSIYASWCVMRQARASGVPVLLNGQGADELFSGYWPAYYLSLARMLRERPWKAVGDLAASMLPGGNVELLRVLPAHMRQYLHRRKGDGRNMLQPHWQDACRSITNNWAVNSQRLSREEYRTAEVRNVHLPRLLQWEDRNSMAFSIEGRYPFLDYRIVDLAFSIPPDLNMRRGWTKYMLREAFRDLLPEQICWRKEKIGFETPQADWIRSSLAGVLSTWSRSITPALRQIIDSGKLVEHVATMTARRSISRMDEHQKRVIRLFMLDTWLRVFRVEF